MRKKNNINDFVFDFEFCDRETGRDSTRERERVGVRKAKISFHLDL